MSKQAIDAPRLNTFLVDPADLKIITDEKHPLYDPREKLPVDEAMVLSIMSYGVVEPVVVAKDGQDVVVIDGRQRVKNAREANRRLKAQGKELVRVPALVKKAPEGTLFGVMVLTNEHRQDDPPLAKAEKLSRFLAMGRSEAEAAVVFGMKEPEVKNLLKLLDCAKPVQKAVQDGVLSVSAAANLSSLPRTEQADKLEKLLKDAAGKPKGKKHGRVTVREAKKATGKGDARPSPKEVRELFTFMAGRNLPGDADAVALLAWICDGKLDGYAADAIADMRQAEADAAKKAEQAA